jgi:hypothetical protein
MSEGYPFQRAHRPSIEQLVENSRGVCFMAFSRVEIIAAALGCSIAEADVAQREALDDFGMLMAAANRGGRG